MSVHTDGQICFGVAIEHDISLPWEGYDNIEDWWTVKVLGFKHSFEIWTPDGNGYIGGKEPSKETLEAYFQEKRDFKKNNPSCPVKIVNYCSLEDPMYILALPETILSASRGYPVRFYPADLNVSAEQVQTLLDFCRDYNIPHSGVNWYLSSYWG